MRLSRDRLEGPLNGVEAPAERPAEQQRPRGTDRLVETLPSLLEGNTDTRIVAIRRSGTESRHDTTTRHHVQPGQHLGQRRWSANDRVGHRGEELRVPGTRHHRCKGSGAVEPGRTEDDVVVGGDGLEAECRRGLDVVHQVVDGKPLTTEIHERQVDAKPHLISPPRRLVSANTAHLSRSALSGVAGAWPAALSNGPALLRHPAGVGERASQQHLNVGVEAAELVVGPADERVVDRRIDPQQDLPAVRLTYRANRC